MDEFAEYGFDNSNMNRIVAASRIAKGSFYQYFENKKDLYFHLMDTVVKRKMAALSPVLQDYADYSFNYNLRELVRLGLAFADSDPKLYRIGEDFAKNKRELINEFTQKYIPLSEDIFGKILQNAHRRGELREDMNVPLAGMFVSILMSRALAALLAQPREQLEYAIPEMLNFIERAVLKP